MIRGTGRSWRPPALALLHALGVAAGLQAAESKAETKPEPPTVLVIQPLGVLAGETAKLRIRGQRLTNATEVRVEGIGTATTANITARGEAKGITGYEPARVGDQQLEVTIAIPKDAPAGTNATLAVVSPAGESRPFRLLILPPASVTTEKEPNDGFRTAPGAPLPIRIRGTFEAKGDVDVFRITPATGRVLRAEVFAARLGSTLDAMLTVYDERYAMVASVDDSVGRDPALEFEVKQGGDYFVAVTYANDQAAPSHEYVLVLEQR